MEMQITLSGNIKAANNHPVQGSFTEHVLTLPFNPTVDAANEAGVIRSIHKSYKGRKLSPRRRRVLSLPA